MQAESEPLMPQPTSELERNMYGALNLPIHLSVKHQQQVKSLLQQAIAGPDRSQWPHTLRLRKGVRVHQSRRLRRIDVPR